METHYLGQSCKEAKKKHIQDNKNVAEKEAFGVKTLVKANQCICLNKHHRQAMLHSTKGKYLLNCSFLFEPQKGTFCQTMQVQYAEVGQILVFFGKTTNFEDIDGERKELLM